MYYDLEHLNNMRNSGMVLYICAGLLLGGDTILAGSASWTLMRISYYFWTTDLGVELAATVLFIAGAVLSLPVCWLSTLVPYNPRSIPLLATLMLLVTSTLVLLSTGVASISGLSRALRDHSALNSSMHRALQLDAIDHSTKNAIAAMQLELKCCGVQSYTDWHHHRRDLPPSCCGRLRNMKEEHCYTPTYYTGCLRYATRELRMYINSLAILGCAIIVVMTVTLIATVYTLVKNTVEEPVPKYQQPLRISCISHCQAPPASPLPNAPLVPM